jgi:tripartite-type tricarboxylate transporter receptor subunit TctC
MRSITRIMGAIAVAALGLIDGQAHAQQFPDHAIRLMVGFAPGGTTTLLGRLVAEKLTTYLNQSVVVETHPGASGIVAAQLVAKSPPDGYTLLFSASTQATNLNLYKSVPYDTIKDFTPIGLAVQTPYVLVVHPSIPAHNLKELIAYLKANPGKLSFASPGSGTGPHLSGELLKRMAGVNMVNISYKGSGGVFTDLLSGRVAMAFGSLGLMAPFIKAGKVRAIATTGAMRSSIMPDIPTMAESGLPNFKVVGWFGIFGPAHMPPAVVRRINDGLVAIMKDPAMDKQLLTQGAEPMTGPPSALSDLLAHEIDVWGKIIKEEGIKGE